MTGGGNDENDENKYSSYNPIDNETPEERESRMKLVRELQKAFYKDEEAPTVQVGVETENATKDDTSSATIQNLPLWRVQWTELPGSQNVLNVHVPHYTNMFQKILKGQSKTWGEHDDDGEDTTGGNYYFGHIFLPGGSENLDNPDFALREGDVGTLMRVCDSRQQSDGRLTLVVQALEKFEISSVVRSHSPYAIADVSVCIDDEQIGNEGEDDDATTEAVSKAFANHPFEYRKVSIDECEITSDDGTVVGLSVSPLSNFDATQTIADAANESVDSVAVAESEVWIQLDELLKLLRIASNGVGVPVPTQLMGLLPQSRSVVSQDRSVVQEEWPSNFGLNAVVTTMEEKAASTVVGTHSKSPFVRVDSTQSPTNYSTLRRAQRLSYVAWTLTDSIALPTEEPEYKSYSPETILGITSTQERLELATDKMAKVCVLLKNILRMQGWNTIRSDYTSEQTNELTKVTAHSSENATRDTDHSDCRRIGADHFSRGLGIK